jgi:hypothetical protein
MAVRCALTCLDWLPVLVLLSVPVSPGAEAAAESVAAEESADDSGSLSCAASAADSAASSDDASAATTIQLTPVCSECRDGPACRRGRVRPEVPSAGPMSIRGPPGSMLRGTSFLPWARAGSCSPAARIAPDPSPLILSELPCAAHARRVSSPPPESVASDTGLRARRRLQWES